MTACCRSRTARPRSWRPICSRGCARRCAARPAGAGSPRSRWEWRRRRGRPPTAARRAEAARPAPGARGRLRPHAPRCGRARGARAPRALRGLPPALRARQHDARDVEGADRAHARGVRAPRHALAHARRGARAPRLPRGARRAVVGARTAPACVRRPVGYSPSRRAATAEPGEDQRMKVYDFVGAPNPKKLRVYLAEKGLRIPFEPVNIVTGDNRKPEFLKKNPMGGLPVLELDDGSCLSESLAIMEYLEELHPTPPMLGTTPRERARVRELERIAEIGILSAVGQYFQNTHPFMASRFKQSPEAAENAKARLGANLKVLHAAIGAQPFVAGERATIADCTPLAALEFAEFSQAPIDPACKNVARWYRAFKERPSAAA